MTEEFEARLALFENSKDKVTQFMTYFLSTILLILTLFQSKFFITYEIFILIFFLPWLTFFLSRIFYWTGYSNSIIMISPSQKFEKNEDNLLWRFNRAAIEYIDIKFLEDQKDKGAYEKFSHFFHWRFGAFYSFSQWLLICIFLDFLIFCLSIIKFLKLLS